MIEKIDLRARPTGAAEKKAGDPFCFPPPGHLVV
jgi:hypothetical protein